jgi:hypothetical protein
MREGMTYNPYAPPAVPVGGPAYPQGPTGPIGTIQGDRIVLPNGVPLPPLCFKCGTPGPVTFKRQKFAWSPEWIFVTVLVSWIIGLVLLLALQKRSEFHIPLCDACVARWKRANLYAVLAGLSIAPLLTIPLVVGPLIDDSITGIATLLGFVAWLVLLVVVLLLRKKAIVYPRRIDAHYSWLGGVHPNTMHALAGR